MPRIVDADAPDLVSRTAASLVQAAFAAGKSPKETLEAFDSAAGIKSLRWRT